MSKKYTPLTEYLYANADVYREYAQFGQAIYDDMYYQTYSQKWETVLQAISLSSILPLGNAVTFAGFTLPPTTEFQTEELLVREATRTQSLEVLNEGAKVYYPEKSFYFDMIDHLEPALHTSRSSLITVNDLKFYIFYRTYWNEYENVYNRYLSFVPSTSPIMNHSFYEPDSTFDFPQKLLPETTVHNPIVKVLPDGRTHVAISPTTYFLFREGELHSENDEPALVADGIKCWYKAGKLHRDGDKPAIEETSVGCIREEWYQEGRLHREGDKPAVSIETEEYFQRKWYQKGRLHREGDNPASLYRDKNTGYGMVTWNKNGDWHREGAPAMVIFSEEEKEITEEWHQHGVFIKEESSASKKNPLEKYFEMLTE